MHVDGNQGKAHVTIADNDNEQSQNPEFRLHSKPSL